MYIRFASVRRVRIEPDGAHVPLSSPSLELLEDSPGYAGAAVLRHHVHPLDLRYPAAYEPQCAHPDGHLARVSHHGVAVGLDRLGQRHIGPRAVVVRSAFLDFVPQGLSEAKHPRVIGGYRPQLDLHRIKLT